jgi:hypothetical protein
MTVAQAIYCLEQVQSKIRPVGHGLILTHGWLVVLIVARLSDPITPSLRDRSFLNGFQPRKLAYDHSVPTGRGRAGARPYRYSDRTPLSLSSPNSVKAIRVFGLRSSKAASTV